MAVCDKLSLFSVFSYLDATLASRNIREGEAVLNSGHVVLCGSTNVDNENVHFVSLCLQTSALTSSPHEISGVLVRIEGGFNIEVVTCSCKAGLGGKCKHIAATLLFLTRHDVSALEVLSATDLKCLWNKQKNPKMDKYKPSPISDWDCLQNHDFSVDTNMEESEANEIRNMLIEALPNSSLSVHRKRYQNKPIEVKPQNMPKKQKINSLLVNIFQKAEESELMLELSKVEVAPLKRCCSTFYNTIQCGNSFGLCEETSDNFKMWQQQRQFRITGSRCYGLFTYSKDDWKTKSLKYFWPKSFSNRYTKHGLAFENEARETYKKNLKRNVVECGLVVSVTNPFLGYSPDGIVLSETGEPIKLLEIKCPFQGREVTAVELFHSCPYLKIENSRVILKKKSMHIMDKYN